MSTDALDSAFSSATVPFFGFNIEFMEERSNMADCFLAGRGEETVCSISDESTSPMAVFLTGRTLFAARIGVESGLNPSVVNNVD